MEPRRFLKSDIDEVNSWYLARNMPCLNLQYQPPQGCFIESVAVAFLYRTAGGFVLFENFMTNPKTTHDQRVEALDILITELTKLAKEDGYHTALVLTKHPTILEGCRKHEFINDGTYQLLEKVL